MMNSPFDELEYDESYLPDETTLRSARFLASYGYPVDFGLEPILSQVLSIRKVINHEEIIDSTDAVLHLIYECWVRPANCWIHPEELWRNQPNSSTTYGSPDIIYMFRTKVLIRRSVLLQEEIFLPSGFADWIAAEDDSGLECGGVAISSGVVPDAVVEEYTALLKDDWNGIAESYFDCNEPSLESVDPRVSVAIACAIQRYEEK